RITIGEIISNVPSTTAPPIIVRTFHDARTNSSRAMAQNGLRYKGLTRSQHAIPTTTAKAHHTLSRRAAINNSQRPSRTNHAHGAAEEGATPTKASKGERATMTLVAIATLDP